MTYCIAVNARPFAVGYPTPDAAMLDAARLIFRHAGHGWVGGWRGDGWQLVRAGARMSIKVWGYG